jgi:hypothetical protein
MGVNKFLESAKSSPAAEYLKENKIPIPEHYDQLTPVLGQQLLDNPELLAALVAIGANTNNEGAKRNSELVNGKGEVRVHFEVPKTRGEISYTDAVFGPNGEVTLYGVKPLGAQSSVKGVICESGAYPGKESDGLIVHWDAENGHEFYSLGTHLAGGTAGRIYYLNGE